MVETPSGPPRPPLAPLFLFIPGQVFRDPRLSWPAKFCYGLLASIADEEGKCWPSVRRIAESFAPALSPRYTRAVLTELIDAGWLRREVRSSPEAPRATNYWWLTGPLPMRAVPVTTPGTIQPGGPGPSLPGAPDEQLPQSIDTTVGPSSPSGAAEMSTVSTEFSPLVEERLAAYFEGRPGADEVRGVIRGALQGMDMPGGRPVSMEAIALALLDLKANRVYPFSAMLFRRYCGRAHREGERVDTDQREVSEARRSTEGKPRAKGLADELAKMREEREGGTGGA